ncbi:fecR protein [bacterium BMS3Abin07]|nr:fecR protein [bacterium BMS3Abin07]GBE33137.1 fecR protein [bacterium BMS3Bbin05]HDL21377.1 hypothetical protein [Nitrospirota bacterium]
MNSFFRKGLIFSIVIMPLFIAGTLFADMRAGNVVSVRGTALVEREMKEIPARIRLDLVEKDSVVTEKRSRIKMLFRDDSILTLGPDSKLIVKQYLYSPEEKRADSIYELLDGRLRAVVGNAALKVVTPTAYAAARGTIFIIWYDPVKNVTGIAVIEGEVEVHSLVPEDKNFQILTDGQMTLVYTGESPYVPRGYSLDRRGEGNMGYDIGVIFGDVTGYNLPAVRRQAVRFSSYDRRDVQWFRLTSSAPPIYQQPAGSDITPVNINLAFP